MIIDFFLLRDGAPDISSTNNCLSSRVRLNHLLTVNLKKMSLSKEDKEIPTNACCCVDV
jgi:hypothetical protein